MQQIVLTFAFLSWVGHGRRVQATSGQPALNPVGSQDISSRRVSVEGSQAFESLLRLLNPASAAFNPSSLGNTNKWPNALLSVHGRRAASVRQQSANFLEKLGLNVSKAPKMPQSSRQMSREAWERGDAYRPGKKNWFTKAPQDLLDLHKKLLPEINELSMKEPIGIPGAGDRTSLLGTALKSLTTGDLALTLCSPEPPVLKGLRDWLVEALPLPVAVRGLPEEQGRVLSTIAIAMDARKLMDLGTFTGYSSIAMALATADDARVICCEPDVEFGKRAQELWVEAGCESKMQMHEIGAQELMQNMLDNGEAGTVDMIFCDVGDREQYPAIHELAMKLLHVGGVIVYYDTLWAADGVLQHSYYPALRTFNELLANDPRVLASLIPLSYGITVSIKVLDVDGERLAPAREAANAGNSASLRNLLLERRKAVQAEIDAMPTAAP